MDYYALGITLYELLVGMTPHVRKGDNSDRDALFKKTLKERISFPKNFDPDAKDLIEKLCCHDPSNRLGNLTGGITDVLQHQFFKRMNWLDLKSQKE